MKMKTFEGNGYLVHSSEGGRDWKKHKYVYKRKMPNGKWRYFYNQPKHSLASVVGGMSGLYANEEKLRQYVAEANKRSEEGKDNTHLENAIVGTMTIANQQLKGKSGFFPKDEERFSTIPIDERPKRKR